MQKKKYLIQLENYEYYYNCFSERNYLIYKDYLSNIKTSEISNKYNLCNYSITSIVREIYFIILQFNNIRQNKKDY